MDYKTESDSFLLSRDVVSQYFEFPESKFLKEKTLRDFRQTCSDFEDIMAKIFAGEQTEKSIKDLREALLDLELHSRNSDFKIITRLFREFEIFQKLADFIEIQEDIQSDQSILQIGLFIIKNSIEKSKYLCSLALQNGIPTIMAISWKHYNERNRGLVLYIFQTIFMQKPGSELAYIEFIFKLCEKYITPEYFDKSDKVINFGIILSDILLYIGQYEMIRDDEAEEAQIRQFLFDKTMIILTNKLTGCLCSAYQGLSNLIKYSEGQILLEHDDLLELIISYLDIETDLKKFFYIVTLLTTIYTFFPLPLEEKGALVTEQHIELFRNLYTIDKNLIPVALSFYQSILEKYPQFLPAFFDIDFVKNLVDICSTFSSFELKIAINQYLAFIMIIGPIEALELIMDTTLIDEFFFILPSEHSDELIQKLLEAIFVSIQKLPERLKEYMIENSILEELEEINTESEFKDQILAEFMVDE